jgi:hypothetical protein
MKEGAAADEEARGRATRILLKLQIHSRAGLVRRRIAETHVEPTEKV